MHSELHLHHAGGLPMLRRIPAATLQSAVRALTPHNYTLPGFVAEAALGRGGTYITAGVSERSTTIHAAQDYSRLQRAPVPGMNPHFCPAVCWCCERYETYDCCYACAVCYIAKSL